MKGFFEVFTELFEDLTDFVFYFIRRHEQTILFEEVIAKLEHDGKLGKS